MLSGFMTKNEKELYESAEAEYPGINLFWLPSLWFSHNMREAQKQGKVAFNDGARLIMSVRRKFLQSFFKNNMSHYFYRNFTLFTFFYISIIVTFVF
jgi:hypothetical protein